MGRNAMSPRERLVFHIQELERVEELKRQAAECLKESFEAAKRDGYDTATLKVVLKLRKMTPEQRRERRALEAIYLAACGMLEGDPLPDEARRRLDQRPEPPRDQESKESEPGLFEQGEAPTEPSEPEKSDQPPDPPPPQAPLVLKTPQEARQEGADAATAGKRIYDNPYPAGDPCRAAWDEGWCSQNKSHGMETPAAYQRRSTKPPEKHEKPDKDEKPGDGSGGGGDNSEEDAA